MAVTKLVDTLITKQDNVEIVRDQIAAIIKQNADNQVILAAGEPDPTEWALRVFIERMNPWEEWRDWKVGDDKTPIVNVWFDNSNFDKSSSDAHSRQTSQSVFNVDTYALGVAHKTATGHVPGDLDAALTRDRATRFVRNFIMAPENIRLQMNGVVGDRWPQSAQAFQPELDAQQVQQIVASRIAVLVSFNEFSPQITPETLEEIAIQFLRKETGEIYFDYLVDFAP